MALDPDVEARLAPALQRFLGAGVAVQNLQAMADGHAGLTFGFDAVADAQRKQYILKKSPEGVPRRGSTDVYRQAALLRALHEAGYPAPGVPWACESEDVLGAPFIVMERLRGRTFIPWDPAPAFLARADLHSLWTETARLMGALHRFDWRRALPHWEAPTDIAVEHTRWSKLLRHMEDQQQASLAQALAAQLAKTQPADVAIGLTHGDLQPGNVLFEGSAARGLIDWDLAAIAPLGLDVGWLLMIADAESWPDAWRPVHPAPRAALLGAYAQAGGADIPDLAWFQAFSHFRMAAITGLNLKLHRDGRRPDTIWENFNVAVPLLLTRGLALLAAGKFA